MFIISAFAGENYFEQNGRPGRAPSDRTPASRALVKNAFSATKGTKGRTPVGYAACRIHLGLLQDGDIGIGVFPEAHPKFIGVA